MFERMLVPLDGSHIAERALFVAARVARASKGLLVLMQAVGQPLEYGAALAQTPRVQDQPLEAALAEASSYLTILTKSAEFEGIEVAAKVLPGSPAKQILAAVESHQVDLIIMCNHGRTGFTRWSIGSVTHKVVHHSPVPVLVLREKSIRSLSQGDAGHPLSVLVALDGSPLAEAALLPAAHLVAAMATPGPGAIHLTQVVKPLLPTAEEGTNKADKAMLEQARTYLETVAAHLRETLKDSSISITWSVAIDTDVANALIDTAEGGEQAQGVEGFRGYDLIALSTYGRGLLHRWVMGSVAEHVLNASRLPVLIMRPPDPSDTLIHWHAD